MLYYTYLIKINHPLFGALFYVGKSCTENNPIEHVKKHLGHSEFAWYVDWKKEHPEWFESCVLQEFSSPKEQGKAEQDLIIQTLQKYGSFYVKFLKDSFYNYISRHAYSWLLQFGEGSCLNAHASNCAVALKAAQDKIQEQGFSEKQLERFKNWNRSINRENSIKQSHTKEACFKRNKNIKERGTRNTMAGCLAASKRMREQGPSEKQKEAILKMQQAHKPLTKDSLNLMSQTKIGRRNVYQLDDGFIGDYVEVAKHVGYKGKCIRVVEKWLSGYTSWPKEYKRSVVRIIYNINKGIDLRSEVNYIKSY